MPRVEFLRCGRHASGIDLETSNSFAFVDDLDDLRLAQVVAFRDARAAWHRRSVSIGKYGGKDHGVGAFARAAEANEIRHAVGRRLVVGVAALNRSMPHQLDSSGVQATFIKVK